MGLQLNIVQVLPHCLQYLDFLSSCLLSHSCADDSHSPRLDDLCLETGCTVCVYRRRYWIRGGSSGGLEKGPHFHWEEKKCTCWVGNSVCYSPWCRNQVLFILISSLQCPGIQSMPYGSCSINSNWMNLINKWMIEISKAWNKRLQCSRICTFIFL